ncbi:hypothetical protein L596_025157 [Steinernema carpocapsae]|uniref:Maelstrom domain-containing protein n=1 Tax=Steinernema carpocapsae TaxID=34508 RepID=A0A4U5M7U0_STECR|nr:hypothetical protein L596_025157 [Steinernema carpocapsae]
MHISRPVFRQRFDFSGIGHPKFTFFGPKLTEIGAWNPTIFVKPKFEAFEGVAQTRPKCEARHEPWEPEADQEQTGPVSPQRLEGDDEFLPLEQAVPAVVNKENKKYSSDFKKISDWLGTGSKNGGMDLADIKRTRFVFASIQTYGDLDREVIPAEIALAEFSLRHGILDLYSTIVGPWEITNNVLRFRANFNCKETHQIPIDLKEMLQKKIKFSFKKQVTAEILGRVEPFIAHKQGLRVGLYKERILEFDDEYDIRQSEAETGKLGASSFAQHLSDIKPLLPGPDEDHRWVICLDHEYESILTALEHLKTDVQLEYDGFPTSPERFILASAFVDAFLQNVDERSKSVDSAKLFGGLGSPQFAEGSMPWEANARLFCSYHRKEHNTPRSPLAALVCASSTR